MKKKLRLLVSFLVLCISISNLQAQQISIGGGDANCKFRLTHKTFSFSDSGETQIVNIDANVDWSFLQLNIPMWATATKIDGGISIVVYQNYSGNERHFVLTIENDCTESENITISQAGIPFFGITTTNIISDEHEGQVTRVNVTSSFRWEVINNLSWVSVSPAQGNMNGSFSVTISEPNLSVFTRMGIVRIVEETGLERVITVIQTGTDAILEEEHLELIFDAPAGQVNIITITSNSSWSVTTDVSWLSADPVSGIHNGIVKVTVVEANLSSLSRTGEVTIVEETGLERVVPMVQAGANPTLQVSTDRIISEDIAGQVTDVNVISDYNWAVSTGESWISVKPASGFRNGIFSVSITQPNLVESERIGSVSIVEETGLERVIDVIQYGSGPAVIIDGPSSLSFGYQAGGSITFNVNSNTEWRIHNTSRNWFSVSQESAYGDASITVTTLQYNMDKKQSAKLKIIAKDVADQEIIMDQAGTLKS